MSRDATPADVLAGRAQWARLLGDVRKTLRPALPDGSIQCAVTSPPYYGLRDYGAEGQIGLEQSPQEYVAQIVAVMREVRRVLRDIPRPLKRSPDFAFYRELEALYAEGLEAWAGLPRGAFGWPLVKWADQVMLRTEKRDLLYPSRFAWGFAPGAPSEPLPARTHLWTLTGFATWLRELPGVAWGQGLAGLRGALAELAASGPWPWWLAERRFLARWKELQS